MYIQYHTNKSILSSIGLGSHCNILRCIVDTIGVPLNDVRGDVLPLFKQMTPDQLTVGFLVERFDF